MTTKLNVSNLKPGMIVDTYKEMCDLLGDTAYDIMQNKEIYAQMNTWRNNFGFEIVNSENKRKFRILAIYDKPIPSQLFSKYCDLISEYVAINVINELKESNGECVDTRKNWYIRIGLVGINILRNIDNSKYACNFASLKKITYNEMKEIFNFALDLLEIKELASHADVIRFEDGTYATPEQEAFIRNAEKDLLEKYECETMSDIFRKKKNEEYYNDVGKIVKEKYGHTKYYNAVLIKYIGPDMQLPDYVQGLKYKINRMFCIYLFKSYNSYLSEVKNEFLRTYIAL